MIDFIKVTAVVLVGTAVIYVLGWPVLARVLTVGMGG